MMKFKIGDIVRAKENAPYEMTKGGWVGEVTGICSNEEIIVFDYGAVGKKRAGFWFSRKSNVF